MSRLPSYHPPTLCWCLQYPWEESNTYRLVLRRQQTTISFSLSLPSSILVPNFNSHLDRQNAPYQAESWGPYDKDQTKTWLLRKTKPVFFRRVSFSFIRQTHQRDSQQKNRLFSFSFLPWKRTGARDTISEEEPVVLWHQIWQAEGNLEFRAWGTNISSTRDSWHFRKKHKKKKRNRVLRFLPFVRCAAWGPRWAASRNWLSTDTRPHISNNPSTRGPSSGRRRRQSNRDERKTSLVS